MVKYETYAIFVSYFLDPCLLTSFLRKSTENLRETKKQLLIAHQFILE